MNIAIFLGVHSEDYYGDLDLKSIRKSELLAGLQSSGSTRQAPNPGPKASKPRPAPAKPAESNWFKHNLKINAECQSPDNRIVADWYLII